jgi:TetR/AcrR family fatty acid metabolism transcriptional regulator
VQKRPFHDSVEFAAESVSGAAPAAKATQAATETTIATVIEKAVRRRLTVRRCMPDRIPGRIGGGRTRGSNDGPRTLAPSGRASYIRAPNRGPTRRLDPIDASESNPKPTMTTETDFRSDKRNRILDSAIIVFARTGFHRARVSDIAREAGIAYGLVYHYFKNKEEILNTIFEERWSGFLEAVDAIVDSPQTSEAKLVAVASMILSACRDRPEWVKVLVLEIQRSSRFAEPGQIRAVGRLFGAVARILRDGQAKGEIRGDLDPDVACYIVIGGLEIVITGLVLGVMKIDTSSPEDEYYARVARTVVEIFLRGLAADDAGAN